MSTRAPAHIRQQFGVDDGGDKCRAMPRCWLSYQGPRKSAFLATTYSMISAGALPDQHQKHWRRRVRQQDLGANCGLGSRAAYTRRVSEFAQDPSLVPGRPPDNPRYQSPERYQRASLLHRFRCFGTANEYRFGDVATSWQTERDPERYHAPTAAELAAHRETGHLFSANGRFGGFKEVPGWIWSDKLPLTDTARLVLTYYAMCGLLETGEVHPRQAGVAAMVGISVRSVYQANCELAAIGLIRVAHPVPKKTADGLIRRGPARIVYLPMRTLSEPEAAAERQRLLDAHARYLHTGYWHAVLAAHDALLRDWTGRDHTMAAFTREIRRRLLLAAIPLPVLNELIPAPPD